MWQINSLGNNFSCCGIYVRYIQIWNIGSFSNFGKQHQNVQMGNLCQFISVMWVVSRLLVYKKNWFWRCFSFSVSLYHFPNRLNFYSDKKITFRKKQLTLFNEKKNVGTATLIIIPPAKVRLSKVYRSCHMVDWLVGWLVGWSLSYIESKLLPQFLTHDQHRDLV